MTVRILLATNDPLHGIATGRIRALEIPDVISLEASYPLPPLESSRWLLYLRIAGGTYPIISHASCVGSWAWDAVTVSDEVAADLAADLLDRLRESERWSITEAKTAVFEKWQRGEKILAEDLRVEDE